jgi:hypothetical protein
MPWLVACMAWHRDSHCMHEEAAMEQGSHDDAWELSNWLLRGRRRRRSSSMCNRTAQFIRA